MLMRAGSDGADGDTTGAMDIEAFLRSIERLGFLMARLALGNDDDALDAMQDTMMRLVQRYANKPSAQWRPLFYRMLHNRITETRGGAARSARGCSGGWSGATTTRTAGRRWSTSRIPRPSIRVVLSPATRPPRP